MLAIKHLGPGQHPSGTPQAVHAGDESTSIRVIAPGARSRLAELKVIERRSIGHPSTNDPSANVAEWVRLEDGTVAVEKMVGLFAEARNEIMAYELGQVLGVNVPETVRLPDNEKHIRQRWAEGELGQMVLYRTDPDRVIDHYLHPAVAALDFITNQKDRHDYNYLVQSDGSIVLIDNGNTLHPGATTWWNSESWWNLESSSPFVKAARMRDLEIPTDLTAGLRRVMYDKRFPIQVRARADYLMRYGFPPAEDLGVTQKWQALVAEWMRTMQKHQPGKHDQLLHGRRSGQLRAQTEAALGFGGGGEEPTAVVQPPKARRRAKSAPKRARGLQSGLAEAKVVARKSVSEIVGEHSVHMPDWILLDDGRQAIEKTLPADEALNEIWAYEAAKILGANVPETVVVRRKRGELTTIRQLWAEGEVAMNVPREIRDRISRSNPAAGILDFITNQYDRHDNNWLVGRDGQPVLIDNGNSKYPELMQVFSARSDSDFVSYAADKPLPDSLLPALDKIIGIKGFPKAMRARAAFLRRHGWHNYSDRHYALWDRIAQEFKNG